MKLPNGYGSVSKLPGKRRKPWRARKTSGWEINDNTGKALQKFITVGYFSTKKEALEALAKFNQSSFNLKSKNITFSEIYDLWSEEHYKGLSDSTIRQWKAAYVHSKNLYEMKFVDIKTIHLETVINSTPSGSATKNNMKSLYRFLFKYAIKNEIVDKNYADLCFTVKKDSPKIVRKPFKFDEIQLLNDVSDNLYIDMILTGIWTGFRPQELCVLKCSDVNLKERVITGGIKTDSGKNRAVPIHKNIHNLILSRLKKSEELNSKNLFCDQNGTSINYDRYKYHFNMICKKYGFSHTPHDTRHTFITLAKESGINDHILKLIVGHSTGDLTERVYTHRSLLQIINEMDKIDFMKL